MATKIETKQAITTLL